MAITVKKGEIPAKVDIKVLRACVLNQYGEVRNLKIGEVVKGVETSKAYILFAQKQAEIYKTKAVKKES